MQNISMPDTELLKFAIEHGMIDTALVQEKIDMQKREEVLNKHPYSIWQGNDEKWRTYLPDEEKGRVLKKRKSKKEIEDVIIKFYKQREDNETHNFFYFFKEIADRKFNGELVKEDTYNRYFDDYERFFRGTSIDTTRIGNISVDDLEIFIVKRIKNLELRKKAAKAMIGYIKSTFKAAFLNRAIKENPCDFLKSTNYFLSFCYIPVLPAHKRTVSKEQMKLIAEKFQEDYKNKPNYIPNYAVELATLTGMRVGEIAALKWDVISDVIIVKREEIFIQKKKEYRIEEYTKNKVPRVIPVTSKIADLLKRVEAVERENGWYGEYVFMNEKGMIHKRVIGECARNKSLQVGIDVKSVHSFRRTVNSTMKMQGVSSTVASAIIGNTVEVNENYYTYDLSDIQEKKEILERANEAMYS